MELLPAKLEELNACYDIIEQGREFQKEQGFVQWTDEYPNIHAIESDIKNSKGFVIKVDGIIAGYMCVNFDGEEAYANIRGKWHTDEKYAVVHRMAFDRKFRGTGLAYKTFDMIENFCVRNGVYAVRADTDFPNKRMQHILEKQGYAVCGTVVFQGGDKMAYDKVLK